MALEKLKKGIQTILTTNLGVKKKEHFLILYDPTRERLANRFKKVADETIEKVEMLKIAELKINGQEPPKRAAEALKKCNTAVILTSKSISHTKARRDATAKGVRIGSMPGITESIIRRSIDIDYPQLKEDTKKVALAMNKAKKVKITTALGTHIELSIKGRKGHGLSAGIFTKKGKWGNLPEGEAFIAPLEGTAQGHFVVDGSIAGIGKVSHPIIFFVDSGNVVRITNGKKPTQIEQMISKVGDKARNIAELGIGLNRKAKVTGTVLEDEKAYGTCHIAMGNNIGFGGKVDVPFHIDCVIKKPSIWFDGTLVMKKGKLLL